MQSARFPRDEDARLAALSAYEILDTAAEADYDEIVRLAARACKAPFAALGLVDAERTWFKAQVGFDDAQTARDVSFCAQAILHDELFLVEDAGADERFRHNPDVAGEPHIRFYAGVPLITPQGQHIGALCVADTTPRTLTPQQAESLRWLGRHAVTLLESRRKESMLRKTASLSPSPKPVDTTDRWRFWPAILALLGGLLLTALAARIAHGLAVRGEEERFAWRAERMAGSLTQRLRSDVALMDAAAALWTPQHAPSASEWDRFFKTQRAGGRYRGLVGLGFIEVVAPAYMIRMVAPAEISKVGVGVDIAALPGRRATAENARDEGRPAMTAPTNFDGTLPNAIVYRPLYRAGMPLDTVARRRAASFGWIYALVRIGDLIDQLPADAAMRFRLSDGDTLLVAAGASAVPLPFHSQRRMPLLGRDWSIALDGAPDARIVAHETRMVLVAGVPITLLFVVMVIVLNSTRRRALAIAANMTRGLRDSELRLRSIVDHIADAVIAFHDDGSLAAFNPAAERLFGYTPSAIIGQDVATILPTIRETAAGGTAVQTKARRSDGREIPVELAVNPVAGDDSKLTVAILHDISERVANEARLRASEERLESFIENADDVIYRADARGRFTFVNATASRLTGYGKERLLRMSYLNLVRPDYSDAVRRFYELQHFDKAANSYLEFPIMAADGREMWLGQKVQPVFDERGDVVGYHGLARDVTDRVRLKDELVLTRDAALESARLKSQFLATMSHEIRTPMNGVIGMLVLLLETDLTEEQRAIATTVQTSADSLLTIINDILDYSKIEAGKLIFERNEFDLVEVVDGSVDLLAEQARAKSLRIAVLIDDDVPTRLRGDAGRLRQVLINLIGNAVKFTEAGSIVIAASADDQSESTVVLRFAISDTGIGIEPDVVGRLFSPFVQADGTMARRFGGTGLGLAICKQLIDQMNGAIGVESEPGRGSTFWFTARLDVQPEAQPEPPPLDVAVAALPAQPRRLRVLVAEDNRVNQQVVVSQLRKLGHTAVAVGNGLEALAALDEIDYDAVLMDCQMPEMDGYEAAAIIRGRRKHRTLPIIAMTANAMAGDRERCLDAGMDDYITKPFKVAQLAQVLSRVSVKPAMPEGSKYDGADVLDESVLAELRSIETSDPGFLPAVIALYLEEAPARVNAVRRAFAAGDEETLWRAAHAFEGASANVGAQRLAEVCAAIERFGRNGNGNGAASALLETLESEYRHAVAALERVSS